MATIPSGTSSETYPLAMLAQTCKKINTDSSSSVNRAQTRQSLMKKSPVKIAPAPKFITVKTLNPNVAVTPHKYLVQLVRKTPQTEIQTNPRAIYTVPLTPLAKPELQTQQTSLQTSYTAPRVFGVKTNSDDNGVVIVPHNVTSQPQQAVILTQAASPSNIPNTLSKKESQLVTHSIKIPCATKLTQISAISNTPRFTSLSMQVPTNQDNDASSSEIDLPKLISVSTSQEKPQTYNEAAENNNVDQKNATIQITVPPNTSLASLQHILQLAANAAKQYENNDQQVHVVTSPTSQPETVQRVEVISEESIETPRHTARRPSFRQRTQCTCPNCIAKNKRPNIYGRYEKHMHICSYMNCRKEFRKTSHLKSHMRTHTGERPYTCEFEFCGRKFTRSDELLRHHRTHSGIKNFQCIYCEKKFTRSDHLKKHCKIHFK